MTITGRVACGECDRSFGVTRIASSSDIVMREVEEIAVSRGWREVEGEEWFCPKCRKVESQEWLCPKCYRTRTRESSK